MKTSFKEYVDALPPAERAKVRNAEARFVASNNQRLAALEHSHDELMRPSLYPGSADYVAKGRVAKGDEGKRTSAWFTSSLAPWEIA